MRPTLGDHGLYLRAAWWIMLICTVLDRILLVIRFGTEYTGSDDVLFWAVAWDMAHGIFHEPYLYGQNYNPALESLLAVPLLWARIPAHVAMPIVTSLLALLPFLSFAMWHRRRGELSLSMLFLAVPLLLPVEWGMMTTITRGFVSGLALVAAVPWVLSIAPTPGRDVKLGLIGGAALFVNPNALLFGLPFLVWYVFRAERKWATLLRCTLGALPFYVLQELAVGFYASRPWRILRRYDDWHMNFAWKELIPEGISQLDLHFAWLTPIWWKNGHLDLWLIAIIVVVLLMRGRRRSALALATIFPFILVSLAFPKIHDGALFVLYPYSRMFLAIPLVLVWGYTLLPSNVSRDRSIATLLVFLAPLFLVMKAVRTPAIIQHEVTHHDRVPVPEFAYSRFRSLVDTVAAIANEQKIDLVVAFDGASSEMHHALCLGASILRTDFPPTLYIGVDRRWWRRVEETHTVRSTILFVGGDPDLWKGVQLRHPEITGLEGSAATFHILRGNTDTTAAVFGWLGRRW